MTNALSDKRTKKNPLNFSVGFQNVEGLHINSECFLSDITDNIINDIHFLAETWSCGHEKEISGYKNLFKNGYKSPGVTSGRSSGGLLVYIKENLYKHVKVLKFTPYCIWLEIDKNIFTNLSQNLLVSAQYVPPVSSKYYGENSLETFREDILNFCDENTPTIFVGDFNARTGSIPDNLEIDLNFDHAEMDQSEFRARNNCDEIVTTQGKNLVNILIGRNLRIMNGRTNGDSLGNFTTFKNLHTTVNDFGIVSENIFSEVENFFVLPQTVYSDHAEIVIVLDNKNALQKHPHNDTEGWYQLGKKLKWDEESLQALSDNLNNISAERVNELFTQIENGEIAKASRSIIDLIDNSVPKSMTGKVIIPNKKQFTRKKRRRKKDKIWFDKELKDLKKNSDKFAILKHGQPGNLDLKERHREALSKYREKFKEKRAGFSNKTFENMENAIDHNEELWKQFKTFSETRLPKATVTEKIHANSWKAHFQKLHTETRNQDIPLSVENRPSKALNKPFKMKELQAVIKNMKNKKAEGTDKIANEMIKHFPEKLLNLILALFNKFLEKGQITHEWCLGLIAPLFKENDKSNPDNYRGICISNALLKCVCLMLNNRLKKFCAKNNLIAMEQIGFKEKSRTTDHILTIKTLVSNHLNAKKGNKVFACFIDLKKAYDSIHHKALFQKLRKNNINGSFLNLIIDLYSKTKCAVKVNGKRTDFFDYSKGVRQGCPLSPLLFNLFINGIVKKVDKNNPNPLKFGDKNISSLLYADDLVIFSSTREGLQKSLNSASEFFEKWNLSINYDKTKCMTFNKKGGNDKNIFHINSNPLENVKSYKYLGITISNKNCSLKGTLLNLSVKANRALFSLKTNLNLMKMPVKLLLKLYDTMILPILLYGAEIWVPSGKYTFESWDKSPTEKEHLSLLKQILGVNRSVQNNMVRAEFGRLPLIYNAHVRAWQYIRYLRKKTQDTCVKMAYDTDCNLDAKFSTLKELEASVKIVIANNLKLHNDLYKVSKFKLKLFLKNDYVRHWKARLRESTMASTYATHKQSYMMEKYLTVVKIRKHRVALSKLRLSDHNLHIHSGRQTRPITPRAQRHCNSCPDKIEDEPHFLVECSTDIKIKTDFLELVSMEFPNFRTLSDKNQQYKFIMKIHDENLLKSLAFCINLLFKNRENLKNT